MSRVADDPLLAAIVAAADDAPIGLSVIAAVVRTTAMRLGGAEEDTRARTLELVREALRRRLLLVGTVEDRFVPWHVSVDDAIARIEREWDPQRPVPRWGTIAAFATVRSAGLS